MTLSKRLKNVVINCLSISGNSEHLSIKICDLKPHANFQKPTTTPSGRKVSVVEEKREEKKPVIGTFGSLTAHESRSEE